MVQKCLLFIAYSRRKLTIAELLQAISTPDTVGAKLDRSNTITEREIIRRCSSLIRKSKDGRRLEFAHFSVQEFLEDKTALLKSVSQPSLEAYHISREIGEKTIVAQCLRFLQLKNFDQYPTSVEEATVLSISRNKDFPFYAKAAMNWVESRNCYFVDDDENEADTLKLMISLFHPRKTSNFVNWALEVLTEYCEIAKNIRCYPNKEESSFSLAWTTVIEETFRPLHFAAALNIPELCNHFLISDSTFRTRSQMFRLLEFAVMSMIGLSTSLSKVSFLREISTNWDPFEEAHVPSKFSRNSTIDLLFQIDTTLSDYEPLLDCVSILSTSLVLATCFWDWTPTVKLLSTGDIPSAADFDTLKKCLVDTWENWREVKRDETKTDESTLALLEYLNSTFKAESDWGFHMCSMVWHWALQYEIILSESDAPCLDSRITMTRDALHAKAVGAIRDQKLEQCLADPRFDPGYQYAEYDGGTLLHIAMGISEAWTIKVLLDAGCDPDCVDKEGRYPLHHLDLYSLLVMPCAFEILELFLAKNISLLSTDANGSTIWHIWASKLSGPIECLQKLHQLDCEASETALKAKDHDGHTPLTIIFKTILERRYDDDDGYEGYFGSRSYKDNLLCNAGQVIQMSHKVKGFWESHPDMFGRAARVGSVELIQALLRADAPLDPGETGACTPLHQLGPRASVGCLELLLSLYPAAADNQFRGYLPIELYLQRALEDCIPPDSATLGAFIKSTKLWSKVLDSSSTIQLIKRFIGCEEYDFIGVLLNHGLDVHQRVDGASLIENVCSCPDARRLCCTSQGRTFLSELFNHTRKEELNKTALAGPGKGLPLLHALLCNHQDCNCNGECSGGIPWLIRKLVSQGANLNSQCDGANGLTPLCYYLYRGCFQYAELLLDLGADPTLRAHASSWGPAQYAVVKNKPAFLRKLFDLANINGIKIPWERTYSLAGNAWAQSHPNGVRTFQGLNDLHLASFTRSVECLQLLLNEELIKNVNAKSADGYTPLHFAVISFRDDPLAVMQSLMSKGADVSAKGGDGNTPLHFAAWNGLLSATKYLMDHGAAQSLNVYGKTPRCYALQQGHESVVHLLETSQLSDISQTSLAPVVQEYTQEKRIKMLATLFEKAIMAGDLGKCRALVTEGCPMNVRMPGGRGISPLMAALLLEKGDICAWLLENGASVLESTHRDNLSVIEVAATKRALISVLPPLLTRYVSEGGDLVHGEDYPIHETILADNMEGLELLLGGIKDMRRTIAYVPDLTCTPVCDCVFDTDFFLLMSSERGQISFDRVIPTVLNRKMKCDSDYFSATALHIAVRHNLEEAVSLLVEAGADLDAQDGRSITPLTYANTRKMAECLLNLGASPTALLRLGSIQSLMTWWGPASCDMLSLHFGTDSRETDWKLDGLVEIQQSSPRNLVFTEGIDVGPESLRTFDQMGVDLLCEDATGRSLMHCIMCSDRFTSPALRDFGLGQATPFPWHLDWRFIFNMAFITTKFALLKRLLPFETFRRVLNLEPDRGWSPLCRAAAFDRVDIIENCLSMGAKIDFEGAHLGSALVVASVCESLQAVKCLIRHGAAIAYTGSDRFTSALTKTRSAKIRAWLLVGRFTEVMSLTQAEHWRQEGRQEMEVRVWSGIGHARVRLIGKLAQRYDESIMMYAKRLAEWKRSKLGTVVYGC